MELLASESCALDLWQATRVKLSLSTPMRDCYSSPLIQGTNTLQLRDSIQNRDPLHHTQLLEVIRGNRKKLQNLSIICTIANYPGHKYMAKDWELWRSLRKNWQIKHLLLQLLCSSALEQQYSGYLSPHLLNLAGIVQLHFGYYTARVKCCSRSFDVMDATGFCSC
jgi:hypothetical protein